MNAARERRENRRAIPRARTGGDIAAQAVPSVRAETAAAVPCQPQGWKDWERKDLEGKDFEWKRRRPHLPR